MEKTAPKLSNCKTGGRKTGLPVLSQCPIAHFRESGGIGIVAEGHLYPISDTV
ncbi:MAG: hypothetical protein WAT22_14395 [Saprospiraceae bacterium]